MLNNERHDWQRASRRLIALRQKDH
jgi:hypothetical protein